MKGRNFGSDLFFVSTREALGIFKMLHQNRGFFASIVEKVDKNADFLRKLVKASGVENKVKGALAYCRFICLKNT